MNNPSWRDFEKCFNRNITFRIKGELYLAPSDDEVLDYKVSHMINNNSEAICLTVR